jgi:hypothetical protein
VHVSLGLNNSILIEVHAVDSANLTNELVGEHATKKMLEILTAVLIEPWMLQLTW